MCLAVYPWTGNSHEISRQFADDHLDLLMGWLAKDTCEDGMSICALMPLAETALEVII